MKKILGSVVCMLVLFMLPAAVAAQGATEVENRINELKQKISDLQGEENSLSKQIGILNSQISLTSLRINTTKSAIDKLSSEIDALESEVARLEGLKTKRLELVLHRIPQTYKRRTTSEFGGILFSANFFDFLSRVEYLVRVQEKDAELYRQLQNAQDHYNEIRTLREKKKEQYDELKSQLEQQNRELDRQKRDKQSLLDQTRNSEAVYQQLLAQALAEKQAIERALVNSVKVGPVKRGDPIALVGNTGYPGCSTGPHLHFEVRKNGTWVDPSGYLSNKTVNDEQNGGTWSVGGGSWDWPVADTVELTQHFGHTPWSWRYAYSGGIHTGFDMTSSSSTVIRAPADGTLYSSSEACGTSSIIKIKYIDHGDNTLSFYLHVQ